MKKITYNITMQGSPKPISRPVTGIEAVKDVLAVRDNGAPKQTSPRYKWTLGHMPTGFRVAVFKTKSEAITCGLELFENPDVKAFLLGGGETPEAKSASAVILEKYLW